MLVLMRRKRGADLSVAEKEREGERRWLLDMRMGGIPFPPWGWGVESGATPKNKNQQVDNLKNLLYNDHLSRIP